MRLTDIETQEFTDSFTDMNTTGIPILLASSSDIRRRILEDIGVSTEVVESGLNEDDIFYSQSNLAPGVLARKLAEEKARIVSEKHRGLITIGADQILRHKNYLLQKPENNIVAIRERLKLLRGNAHTLHCAAVISQDGNTLFEHDETVLLVMRRFSDAALEEYLGHGGIALAQSVGAYRLEEKGLSLFEHIEGNFHAALGLPVLPLLEALRTLGAVSK